MDLNPRLYSEEGDSNLGFANDEAWENLRVHKVMGTVAMSSYST